MTDEENIDWTLVLAFNPRIDDAAGGAEVFEVDTSCPWVPFGFIRMIKRSWNNGEDPRDFWAACIGKDEMLDLLSANIIPTDFHQLKSIFQLMVQDTRRVGESMILPNIEEGVECLRLTNGCSCCFGAVLLMRFFSEIFYIHWHRES